MLFPNTINRQYYFVFASQNKINEVQEEII